jgi:isoleucyl-tRNA synthetase
MCIVASVTADESATSIVITPSEKHKCGRCWRLLPEVTNDGALCDRCEDILA